MLSRPLELLRPDPDSKINNDDLVIYSYNELAEATGYFNYEFILGKGGFGEVFKGTLSGETVAIKKLLYNGELEKQKLFYKSGWEELEKQFKTEIEVLAKLKDENLVKMLGYCCEKKNRLIVLEFMPMISLDSQLHGDHDKPVLDWSKRMKVALGSAKGIATFA